MRILFLTNFYPPASLGGYEQWCQEVAERLQDRHRIVVLTNRHGRGTLAASEPDWVRRDLHLEMDLGTMRNGVQFFTRRRAREQENREALRTLLSGGRRPRVVDRMSAEIEAYLTEMTAQAPRSASLAQ